MQPPLPATGSRVRIRQRVWLVEQTGVDRQVMRLDVRHRAERLTFLAPFDRVVPLAGRRRTRHVGARGARARLSGLMATARGWLEPSPSTVDGLEILGYQLEPWLAFADGARRVLIADAVGLGKTIQAGIVLAELYRRLGAVQALIVTPASLRDQWAAELDSRFGLRSAMADRLSLARTARVAHYGETPWLGPAIWIGSSDYLKQPQVRDGMPLAAWDLLVIDEAHDVTGRSERHAACDDLARRARRVLLLSATPHAGDEARFSRLTSLGALPAADDRLVVFRRTRTDAGVAGTRTVRWRAVTPAAAELRLFQELRTYEDRVLGRPDARRREAALLLLTVFRKRALSTATALERSLTRRLEWLSSAGRVEPPDWTQPGLSFDDEDVLDNVERAALTCDIGVPGSEERRWLRRLLRFTGGARREESRIRHLVRLLGRIREPVVVFTEFRDSLDALRLRLEPVAPVAILHGGLTAAERRAGLQRFLDGSARVLLATDVGGQGLNLQPASRWVVSFELPWTPTRIEQRIGRVDRIGQIRHVHATLLYSRDRTEERVLIALARRLLAAQDAMGMATLTDIGSPPETALAAALIGGDTLPLGYGSGQLVPLSTDRCRTARALGRLLLRRRRLQSRWRADGQSSRIAVHLPDRRTNHAGRFGVVAVYAVPIVDAAGATLERHLTAVRLPQGLPSDGRLAQAVLESAARVAASRYVPRVRRLRRLVRKSTRRTARTERALCRHLLMLRRAGEVQPGLFSRRHLRVFESAREEAAATDVGAVEARAELRRSLRIGTGRAVLELLVRSR